MGWLSLKAGHLITRLCARMLQSTKEDNVMPNINQSSSGDAECKPNVAPKSRIKVKRLSRKESLIFNKQVGLTRSYLVIGNTTKGARK